jgi:DNA (cytosine-5)-methyltransferase 1
MIRSKYFSYRERGYIMKFISLFAGVGGFDLALERLGHECVYANDFDKYCKQIYDKNFCINRETNGGSESNTSSDDEARKGLESEEGQNISSKNRQYGKHSNSNTGKRAITLDCRSITEVTTDEIPDHNLLVGGFPCQSFSIAGKRRGFEDTRGTMFFEVARILKAKQPRLFILENVKGLLSHDNGNTFKTIIATITELGYDCEWQVLNSKNFGVPQNRERVFIVGHLRETSRQKIFPITGSNREDYFNGQYSTTINSGGGGQGAKTGLYMINAKIRRLTPVECERLQGFPDGWTEGVSDTQRYKMMGNAVTVNVVYEVAKLLVT